MENETKLTAGDAELTLEPGNGCRIASLKVAGTELLRQGDRFGAFLMVPWAGRTENGVFRNGGVTHQLPVDAAPHAIHGTVRHRAWQEAAPATATTASYHVELTDPWPYPGRVTHTVELAPHSVKLTLSVEVAPGGDSFPAQAGWHPWWNRNLGKGGQDVELAFRADWQEERGDNHLPNGNRITPKPGPWDDCFGMPDGVDVTLTWPGELRLEVQSPAQWVVVYDEQPEAVCVEPQSGPPNGLNTTPRLVTPIDPLEITTTWSWHRIG
ncbi:aldose epimerase [Streptomyces sp. NRRL F-5123]|uniref:aldose epimerase family protein n=1 Tax=Streptomyces sp. NRRL F-5123 TaxID=1463856 RepID=UPI0004E111D9|nr:aldose epimerase [Streptomyces sp. NRRL F-5123]